MQKTITIRTDHQNGLYDITADVVSLIKLSKVKTGIASIYARGSTAAIMIQENWDQSVQNDVISLLRKLIPSGHLGTRPQGQQRRCSFKGRISRSFRDYPDNKL